MHVRPGPRRALLGVALATAVGATSAPAASAQGPSTVSLSKGGDTRLTLDRNTARALTSLGVRVAPIRPSSVRGGAVRFPITGGSIDPVNAAGVIRHSGGLQLTKGHTKVRLRNFRIRGTRLAAAVGKWRATIMTLDLRRARVTRPRVAGLPVGTRVANVAVRLNATGARALNRAFQTQAFKRGLRLGSAVVNARPRQVIIQAGTTALTLDPATASTLTGTLGLTLGVIAPAAANDAGAIGFPIETSRVALDLSSGTIAHTGGLSLAKGAASLTLTDFDIKLGGSPTLAASVNGGDEKADIVDLGLSGAANSLEGRTLTISGVQATLNQTASDALTATFGAPATQGAPLGTAVVTAQLR